MDGNDESGQKETEPTKLEMRLLGAAIGFAVIVLIKFVLLLMM